MFSVCEGRGAARNLHSCTLAESTRRSVQLAGSVQVAGRFCTTRVETGRRSARVGTFNPLKVLRGARPKARKSGRDQRTNNPVGSALIPRRRHSSAVQPTPSRSVGERVLDQSSPALYAKRLEDPPQVSGDGSRTAAQFTGNFAVGEALRHEPNDLSLPIR